MEYKRKKTGKKSPKKTKRKKKLNSYGTVLEKPKTEKYSNIKMRSKGRKNEENQKSIRLVMGKKEQKQRRRIFVLAVVCILLAGVVLFSALTPTGPFEYIQNRVLSLGSGSYPAAISGSEMKSAYFSDSLLYTLSDTHAEIFNGSGKRLFSRQHEFNSPTLAISSQRALLYDAGGKDLYIFNHSDVISEHTVEYDIYCAAIGRNGTLAIASKSKGYASQVQVLSKNGKEKFVWYSSDETVNNVAVADSGRKIAVSTVSASGGKLKSKVYVFKFSQANPLYHIEYDDELVYSLKTVSGSYFSVATEKTVDFIKWKNGNRTTESFFSNVKIFHKNDGKKSIAVAGSKSSNRITVYGSSGNKLAEFDFSGSVSDAALAKDCVYLLSDGYLYSFDFEGNPLFEKVNISSYNRIFSSGKNSVIAAGNFGIDKF